MLQSRVLIGKSFYLMLESTRRATLAVSSWRREVTASTMAFSLLHPIFFRLLLQILCDNTVKASTNVGIMLYSNY